MDQCLDSVLIQTQETKQIKEQQTTSLSYLPFGLLLVIRSIKNVIFLSSTKSTSSTQKNHTKKMSGPLRSIHHVITSIGNRTLAKYDNTVPIATLVVAFFQSHLPDLWKLCNTRIAALINHIPPFSKKFFMLSSITIF